MALFHFTMSTRWPIATVFLSHGLQVDSIGVGPVITYNCQSLKRSGRLGCTLGSLSCCSVVAFIGTRWKAKENLPVGVWNVKGFLVVHAGDGKNSSSHYGVALCYNKRWYGIQQLVAHAYTTGHIQGRALAIRSMRGCSDTSHCGKYWYPAVNGNPSPNTMSVIRWTRRWLSVFPCKNNAISAR